MSPDHRHRVIVFMQASLRQNVEAILRRPCTPLVRHDCNLCPLSRARFALNEETGVLWAAAMCATGALLTHMERLVSIWNIYHFCSTLVTAYVMAKDSAKASLCDSIAEEILMHSCL
jgi:hypothetical protein